MSPLLLAVPAVAVAGALLYVWPRPTVPSPVVARQIVSPARPSAPPGPDSLAPGRIRRHPPDGMAIVAPDAGRHATPVAPGAATTPMPQRVPRGPAAAPDSAAGDTTGR